MKKTTRRLAEILGVPGKDLDELLSNANYQKYTEKQVEAVVKNLDKHEPFSRVNILGFASNAAIDKAPAFWHRVAKLKNGVPGGNLLAFALRAKPPAMEIRSTERELGRELKDAELDKWIDAYRRALFDNSMYVFDKSCPQCGTVCRIYKCRICGTGYCDDCGVAAHNKSAWSAQLVCKNCIDKLPKGW